MPKLGLSIGEFCYSNDCVRTPQETNFRIVFQAFIIISFFLSKEVITSCDFSSCVFYLSIACDFQTKV